MSAHVSGLFILAAAAIAWVSVVILARAARRQPRIGALTERAVIGAGAALFVTLKGLIAVHADQGFPFFDARTSETILRIAVLFLGLLPVYWLALYLRGRLGE